MAGIVFNKEICQLKYVDFFTWKKKGKVLTVIENIGHADVLLILHRDAIMCELYF